ncbi:Mediator of RNA polymerase II transcription subunit 6 [Rhodotorula toruloides]|nr:Mediator of RNA polymerase II transcription subunit 6 [Rhodotorula toruloides]
MTQQPALNLSHLQWRAPEFLLAFGSLSTPQLAMEYFSLSPFFDKTSNNAQLRMQMMFSRGGMEGVDEEAELRRFVGLEFVIAHSTPPDLFIIHKRNRTSPTESTVLGAFYILNGNVYQAPTLFEVLNERILTSLHALSTSLNSLTSLKPHWTPSKLYKWDIKPPPQVSTALAVAANGEPAAEDTAMRENDAADGVEQEKGAVEEPDREEDAEKERPEEAFNPLLFRALQDVARTMEQSQMAGVDAFQHVERLAQLSLAKLTSASSVDNSSHLAESCSNSAQALRMALAARTELPNRSTAALDSPAEESDEVALAPPQAVSPSGSVLPRYGGTKDTQEPMLTRGSLPVVQFYHFALSLVPTSTRRDALRAWDRTADVAVSFEKDGSISMESQRVQAALGLLVDLLETPNADPLSSPIAAGSKAASSTAQKRPLSPAPVLDLDTMPTHKRVRAGARSAGRAKSVNGTAVAGKKGKGKEKEVAVVLGSSDEEEVDPLADSSIEIISSPVKARRGVRLDKGKSRAIELEPSPEPAAVPAGEIVLLSDDDEPFHKPVATEATPPAAEPTPLEQVLFLIPDVLPDHAQALLESSDYGGNVEAVVYHLLEQNGKYPKIEEPENKVEVKKDWLDVQDRRRTETPSPLYRKMGLDHLYAAFPLLPAALIKKTFLSPDCASFFAPTYQLLNKRLEAGEYDAQKLRKGRKPPKKTMRLSITSMVDDEGKSHRVVEEIEAEVPEELKQEIEWLKARLLRERHERLRAEREEKAAQEERERVELLNEQARQNGEAVECGCCFDEVALENSAQCAEGHLFCKTCAVANASDRIGRRQAVLPCMTAECTATFPPATYSSFLPPRMIESLASIAQQVDLDTAFDGVDGFEKCPFCPYACYIENPQERLLRCERPECRKVTCRQCKKESHLPLSCVEADKDSRLAGVHAVAEAMSAALIRPCPSCKVPATKIDGCNKMTCSQCHAHWCYVCRKKITNGYAHFSQATCPQFDDTRMREHKEVEAARLAAQADLDDLTKADAAVLADEAPVRGPPVFPQRPNVVPGAAGPPNFVAAPLAPAQAARDFQDVMARVQAAQNGMLAAILAWRR